LQDLDSTNLSAARQKLTDDSMELTVRILEKVGFTTNKDVLCNEPGLRGVARYWRPDKLPTDSFVLKDPVLSNQIYAAIAVVATELTNFHTGSLRSTNLVRKGVDP